MRLPRAAFAAVAVAVVIAFAAPRDSYKMLLRSIFRSLRQGDSTAQGVARARHIETIYPIEVGQKRLFEDPYAKHFYAGSAVTALLFDWVAPVTLFRLLGNVNAGVQPAMAGRTAEFDAQVQTAVEAGCKQYVILGAGYDTRGLRLNLPPDVNVFEVDQPKVQHRKRAKLSAIPGLTVPSNIHFVAADFNAEDSMAPLTSHPAYDVRAPTVFTLEGVTPYITKGATANTLAKAASISGPTSRFLISYMPQALWEAPEKCGDAREIRAWVRTATWTAETIVGEPLISGWNATELAATMQAHGFTVERDVSLVPELNRDYFVPAGRPVPDEHQVIIERLATAVKK